MEEEGQRSSFWTTVPGILTGIAAVISAATGGYLAFSRMPTDAGSGIDRTATAVELKPSAAIAATPSQPQGPQASATSPAAQSQSSNSNAATTSTTSAVQASSSQSPAATPDQNAQPIASAPQQTVRSGEARPSFDCTRASTRVEVMLCSDVDLAARDRRAADLYFALRSTLPQALRTELLQSQKRFLAERSNCSNSECLAVLYDARLRQLSDFDSSQR